MQVITNLLRDAAYLLQHHRLRLVDADLLAAQQRSVLCITASGVFRL